MTTHELLRERLLIKAGVLPKPNPLEVYNRLVKSEWSAQFEHLMRDLCTPWSDEFEQLMRNRLVMGAMRYGLLGYANKPKFDRMGSVSRRLCSFQQTGNLELMVDVANICLVEWVEGSTPERAPFYRFSKWPLFSNWFEGISQRVEMYSATFQKDLLPQIAAMCMKEFMNASAENRSFESIDDGEHAIVKS